MASQSVTITADTATLAPSVPSGPLVARANPLTTPREPHAIMTVDSNSGEVELDDGNQASLTRAIQGLRRQLAAEFRALKLTYITGQFQDTQ
jgi:hypothetical protein